MKNHMVYGLLLIVAAVVSCTSGDATGGRMLSPEQVRLERINRIDSTSLSEVVKLDSIDGFEQLSSLTADAWMLIDDSTGCIISEKNADELRHMASITKMMTCLLALENGQMGDTIEITEDVYVAKDSIQPYDSWNILYTISSVNLMQLNLLIQLPGKRRLYIVMLYYHDMHLMSQGDLLVGYVYQHRLYTAKGECPSHVSYSHFPTFFWLRIFCIHPIGRHMTHNTLFGDLHTMLARL